MPHKDQNEGAKLLVAARQARQRTFRGGVDELAAIRDFVGESAAALGAGEEDVFAFQLAADEAASNAFQHAYHGLGGLMDVEVWREGDAIFVRLRDWGEPFDPAAVPEPDLELPLEERPLGGLGLFLIRRVMTDVSFSFDPEAGNTVTMRREIHSLKDGGGDSE